MTETELEKARIHALSNTLTVRQQYAIAYARGRLSALSRIDDGILCAIARMAFKFADTMIAEERDNPPKSI